VGITAEVMSKPDVIEVAAQLSVKRSRVDGHDVEPEITEWEE
jgi:hypothetical protein